MQRVHSLGCNASATQQINYISYIPHVIIYNGFGLASCHDDTEAIYHKIGRGLEVIA